MEFIYDNESLPMVYAGYGKNAAIYRVQRLTGGKWETLSSEQEYIELFDDVTPTR